MVSNIHESPVAQTDTKSLLFSAVTRDAAASCMVPQPTHKALNTSRNRTGKGGSGRRHWIWLLGLTSVVLVVGYWGFRSLRPAASNPDALWTQAERDFMAGRYDRVDSALDRLRQLRQPTPLDWFLLAQLAMASKDDDQALNNLARVPDGHYMAAQARMLAGQTELRRDRVRRAEEFLLAAIKLDPRLVQAHRELIYIYGMQLRRTELGAQFMALSKLAELTFDNVFHWGLLRSNLWDPAEAVESLARYVAADRSDRSSRLALAENYGRMNRFDDAKSTLAPLRDDDPHKIELLARMALDHEGEDEAQRLLSLGKRDDPLLARLRGRLALARRDAKEALADFRIAYAADPENRDTIFGLIAALELSGDKEAALPFRDYAGRLDRLSSLIQRAAVPAARSDPDLMRQLGAACAALDRKGEARAWYKLALGFNVLDSESQQALFRLNEPSQNDHPSSRTVPTP
jgi:tetratricopeptide (TPR) repeat protein